MSLIYTTKFSRDIAKDIQAKIVDVGGKKVNLNDLENIINVAVDTVFSNIKDEVKAGNTVKVKNFGLFKKKHRSSRRINNPITGAITVTTEKDVMAFKPSVEM